MKRLSQSNKSYFIKQRAKHPPLPFVNIASNIHTNADTVSQFYRRFKKRQRAHSQETYEIESIKSVKFKTTHGILQRQKPVYLVKWVGFEELSEVKGEDFNSQALLIEFFLSQEHQREIGGLSPSY